MALLPPVCGERCGALDLPLLLPLLHDAQHPAALRKVRGGVLLQLRCHAAVVFRPRLRLLDGVDPAAEKEKPDKLKESIWKALGKLRESLGKA